MATKREKPELPGPIRDNTKGDYVPGKDHLDTFLTLTGVGT